MASRDVVVVGGGAIGCIAARECCERGLSVAVLEEDANPGKKNRCTGIISKRGLDETRVDYSGSVLNEVRGCSIFSGDAEMTVDSGRCVAFVLDRQKFDEECCREAHAAEFYYKTRAERFKGTKVFAGRRAFNADYLVGADGAASFTARSLGFPAIPAASHALAWQAEYSRARVPDVGLAGVFLEPSLFKGFFGWAVPVSASRVRVGFGTTEHSSLNKSKRAFLSNGRVKKILAGAKLEREFNALIPLSARAATVKGNALLVGDAAGQVKATTGGGVVFGAKCARVLAACVARGEPREYENAWRREAGALKIHSSLRFALDLLSPKETEFLLAAGGHLGLAGLLARFGDMDYVFSKR
ncbi:MAG: NAD(P)/FAD-dependent oxidoreductase [Candidatus Micrarchaeia archaeon]